MILYHKWGVAARCHSGISRWWPAEIHWWAERLRPSGAAPPRCDSWGISAAGAADARWSSWSTLGASCPGSSYRRCASTAGLAGQRRESSTPSTSGPPPGCPWWRLEGQAQHWWLREKKIWQDSRMNEKWCVAPVQQNMLTYYNCKVNVTEVTAETVNRPTVLILFVWFIFQAKMPKTHRFQLLKCDDLILLLS